MDWNDNNSYGLTAKIIGENEYKWEDLWPKLEDYVCLV